ncbi:deoxyribonuclease gamma-like isoform X2 [Protopterus annectens]|nr:deoxyribonuclease gamma-like isoform X2 [Protopterus annectens]
MKIASFNARRFGAKKIANKKVLSTIVEIVSRYDILLMLECVDTHEKAVKKLLEELNSSESGHYSYIISSSIGRNTYKEQYLFVYRDDVVEVKECYQYPDEQPGDVDAFSREPFIVRFKPKSKDIKDIVMIPVHTTPTDSVKEIDELYDVCEMIKEHWDTEALIILGDFNADGRYVSKSKMKQIRLRKDPTYHWLIGDDEDTTACSGTDCSYDRIVVHEKLYPYVVPGSAKVFNFQEAFELAEEEALEVSDHYPVEVELKAKQKAGRR